MAELKHQTLKYQGIKIDVKNKSANIDDGEVSVVSGSVKVLGTENIFGLAVFMIEYVGAISRNKTAIPLAGYTLKK